MGSLRARSLARVGNTGSSRAAPVIPRWRRTIGDFASLSTIPEFQSAWGQISAQLQTENASPLDVAAAQNDLASSFEQLTSSAAGFGTSASDALNAATQYTIAGRTALGAVNHVQGLISAAQGSDPTAAFEMFTGTMIGAAVAAGAVSAGIGALVVAGVGVVLDVLKGAGLFGSAPQGKEICSGLYVDPPPTLQVGCVGTSAPVIQPGSANWRRYPKRSGGNAGDADWYATSGPPPPSGGILDTSAPSSGGSGGYVYWSGSPGGVKSVWSSYPWYRLIDSAFPMAHYMACQSVPSGLSDFAGAFSSAWIANKEYELNGLASQPDWQVLLHLVRIWNRAHAPTSYVDLRYAVRPTIPQPTSYAIRTGNAPCPSGLPFYPSTLVADLLNSVSGSDPVVAPGGSAVRIYTGPLVNVKKVVPFRALPALSGSSLATLATWSAHPSTTTGGTTVAIVSGLALVSAGALYWYKRRR